jgi:outer membrane lipoprotein-sorting protein
MSLGSLRKIALCALLVAASSSSSPSSSWGAAAADPQPSEILSKVLEADPWGLSGAEVTARAIVKDSRGGTRELAFSGRSLRYAPPLSKGIVRFTAPADIAGVGFLQVQKKDDDDDRWLFLPELKRSRRIAGDTRGQAFMGTDFSYADLDRKDLRYSNVRGKGEEAIGKFACWKLDVTPQSPDAPYARAELWVRKDNFVPLKTTLYNKAGVLLKTLTTQEVRRVSGRWFITRSVMVDHQQNRQTELVIEKVTPRDDIPDAEFTVRNLEKI